MKVMRNIFADTEFTDTNDAVSAVMKDAKQKKLYEFMKTLAKDDMLVWLEGVLDCADAFDIDCSGLQYVHDQMYEYGEAKAIKMIDSVGEAITSAIDVDDKPFVVVTRVYRGADDYADYEEIYYAFNARSAKMLADSKYKNVDHDILSIESATDKDLDRLQ